MAFNELTVAEAERLALLLEELGEAQQAIGKVLCHGYSSFNPDDVQRTSNRDRLMWELGDIRAAVELMFRAGDIEKMTVEDCATAKFKRIGKYLHHNRVRTEEVSHGSDK